MTGVTGVTIQSLQKNVLFLEAFLSSNLIQNANLSRQGLSAFTDIYERCA